MVKLPKDPTERMRARKFRLFARAQDMYADELLRATKDGDSEKIRAVEKRQYNYWKRLAIGENCWNCWMSGKVIERLKDETTK